MKRETTIWLIVFLFGAAGLFYNAVIRNSGMAKVYVAAEPVDPANPTAGYRYEEVTPKDYAQHAPGVELSIPRTVGVWFAAFFTLCIFSFLYRDNPFYKVAESVFIGVSAAYYMVAGFWDTIVQLLMAKLLPSITHDWAMPDMVVPSSPNTVGEFTERWIRLIPLALGIMLLWRLAPRGQWISRWPLAVIIGTMAGLRMVTYVQTDLLGQVGNSILPLFARDGSGAFDLWQSLRNIGVVGGVLFCLTYFFFSVEHKGAIGRAARTGIWILMITFGASFALTVMGRIALLSERIQFLMDSWLWLIDPTNARG